MAYQIAFDLYESATQHFLRKVQETIRGSLPAPPTATPTQEASGEEKLSAPVQESGILLLNSSCTEMGQMLVFNCPSILPAG